MNSINPYIIILVFVMVVLFDFIPLIKNGNKKLIWLYSGMLVISFAVLFINNIGFKVPSPFKPIQDMLTNITKK